MFAVFIAINVLNFAMIAGHTVLLRGGSLIALFRTVYLPVLPWELATASLTAMAVYGFEVYGAGIIGLFALALGVCQLLLRALLEGQAHRGGGRAPHATSSTSATRGCSGCCWRRSRCATRAPPATPPRSRTTRIELARAAGLYRARAGGRAHRRPAARHRQGGAARPPAASAARRCTRGERRLLERHPADGARLLLRVEGLGEVATAVLAHHERIDGQGYPDGLLGRRHPDGRAHPRPSPRSTTC